MVREGAVARATSVSSNPCGRSHSTAGAASGARSVSAASRHSSAPGSACRRVDYKAGQQAPKKRNFKYGKRAQGYCLTNDETTKLAQLLNAMVAEKTPPTPIVIDEPYCHIGKVKGEPSISDPKARMSIVRAAPWLLTLLEVGHLFTSKDLTEIMKVHGETYNTKRSSFSVNCKYDICSCCILLYLF